MLTLPEFLSGALSSGDQCGSSRATVPLATLGGSPNPFALATVHVAVFFQWLSASIRILSWAYQWRTVAHGCVASVVSQIPGAARLPVTRVRVVQPLTRVRVV